MHFRTITTYKSVNYSLNLLKFSIGLDFSHDERFGTFSLQIEGTHGYYIVRETTEIIFQPSAGVD